jgi:hypothetical protein
MSVAVVHDAIHANIGHLPPGVAAGYTTGSADIRWTAADWAAHPGAVRICQDTGSDVTADCLDVERGAATNGEAAPWFKAAEKAYLAADRPGQRSPAIYTSASNVTPLVNALTAGGVTHGAALWVANWNLSQAQAYADVVNAAGPFPIIGVQWSSGAFYDTNVFSGTWLARVSAAGYHKHLTVAGDTLGKLAGSRGQSPEEFVAFQRVLGTKIHPLVSAPLPAGVEWQSVAP